MIAGPYILIKQFCLLADNTYSRGRGVTELFGSTLRSPADRVIKL